MCNGITVSLFYLNVVCPQIRDIIDIHDNLFILVHAIKMP